MTHSEWNWQQEGQQIYGQTWMPEIPRAAMVLVHGFAEHSGRYAHWAERFCNKGIAVFAYDQFGHGKTEGLRGYSPSYEASLDSVKIVLEKAEKTLPNMPLFLYGHSMGGNIALNYLLHRKPKIKGGIVTAPWLRLGFEPPKFKLALAKMMEKIYPKFPEKANIPSSGLSRDAAVGVAYDADPLVHNTARAGTFFATHQHAEWALHNAGRLALPLLILHGTDDKLIAHSGSVDFVAHADKSLVTFKSLKGFYHEVHNEPEPYRTTVFEEEMAWVEKQLLHS